VLQHIRLLILDLDYLVFDCTQLKLQALRQSMISLADSIPQDVRLPDEVDVEEGFRDHGFRWLRKLDIELGSEELEDLVRAYAVHEDRLVETGAGRLFPGVDEFVGKCREWDVALALGAEASREYLLAVIDRHQLDIRFQVAMCAEEFGAGGVEEMLGERMHRAEVNPSETLVLGTRPFHFRAAHNLDLTTIGCGWGLRDRDHLTAADHQCQSIAQLSSVLQKADHHRPDFY